MGNTAKWQEQSTNLEEKINKEKLSRVSKVYDLKQNVGKILLIKLLYH